MKRFYGILSLLILTTISTSAQGIEFFEGSWPEALAEAKARNKIIFVDAFTTWCGPCKRMSATVFPQEEVGSFYNERFLNYKLDMEKGEGPSFASKYQVRAYPTLLFIDFDGSLVHRQVGAQQVSSLLSLGKQALKMVDRSGVFAAKYEKGDRDPELIYHYIAALNQAGKSSLRIANDFLRNNKDWKAENTQRIIFESLQQLDSRIYTFFEKNRDNIAQYYSAEEIDRKLLAAANQTLATALEFQSPELLEEAQSKIQAQASSIIAKDFVAKSDMAYGKATEDYKLYQNGFKLYVEKVAPEQTKTQWISALKKELATMGKDKKADRHLEALSALVISVDATYEDYIVYARILENNEKTKDALLALDQAEILAQTQQPGAQLMIRKMREKLNQ